MNSPSRVELVRVEESADPRTVADRESTVQRLAELGHIDPAAGEVNTVSAGSWQARINGGTPIEVQDFAVSPDGEGGVVLNLVMPVDALTIGDASLGQEAPNVRPAVPAQPISMWGGIPQPDGLGSQVAANAEQNTHDHTLKRWTCGCDPVLLGIQDAAAKTGNIDLRVVQS